MPSGNPMTGSATDGDDIELDMGGADLLQRPAVLCCGMAPLRLAFVVSAVSCFVCAVFLVVGLVIFAVLGSSATLGFALENGVDLVGSLFMLWRFWGGGKGVAAETLELREKRSSMAIALMFAILGLLVMTTATAHLIEAHHPTDPILLVSISAPSLVICTVLGAVKMHVAYAIGSGALLKDATCSLAGATISLGIVCSAALFHLGGETFWFVDAAVALVVALALLAVGVKSLHSNYKKGERWWTAAFWGDAPAPRQAKREMSTFF